MARQPEVFARELSVEEGQRLQRIARTSRQPIRLRRAAIVLASAARRPVPDIAERFQTSQTYVRRVNHDFNEQGIGPAARERICLSPRAHRRSWGCRLRGGA